MVETNNFIICFEFEFPLFMVVMYNNEFKTREKIKLKPRILNMNHNTFTLKEIL